LQDLRRGGTTWCIGGLLPLMQETAQAWNFCSESLFPKGCPGQPFSLMEKSLGKGLGKFKNP